MPCQGVWARKDRGSASQPGALPTLWAQLPSAGPKAVIVDTPQNFSGEFRPRGWKQTDAAF